MPHPLPARWLIPPTWVRGGSVCPVFPAWLAQPKVPESVPWRLPPHPAVYKHPKPAQACTGGPWVQDSQRTHNKVGEGTRRTPPTNAIRLRATRMQRKTSESGVGISKSEGVDLGGQN